MRAAEPYITLSTGPESLACTSLPAKRRVSVTMTLPCCWAAVVEVAAFAAASAAAAALLAAAEELPACGTSRALLYCSQTDNSLVSDSFAPSR